jgi:hypothetical protein
VQAESNLAESQRQFKRAQPWPNLHNYNIGGGLLGRLSGTSGKPTCALSARGNLRSLAHHSRRSSTALITFYFQGHDYGKAEAVCSGRRKPAADAEPPQPANIVPNIPIDKRKYGKPSSASHSQYQRFSESFICISDTI